MKQFRPPQQSRPDGHFDLLIEPDGRFVVNERFDNVEVRSGPRRPRGVVIAKSENIP